MRGGRPILFLSLSALGLAFFSAACSQANDPTRIVAQAAQPTAAPTPQPTPTPLPSGVQFNLRRQGDPPFGAMVMHLWVEDGGGSDIRTLWTTNGLSSYSCPSANFCPCESIHWPAFCAANPSDFVDAASSATVPYPVDTDLSVNWDWRDRAGTLVPNGTYLLRAEVSNYQSGAASLATVTVVRNASPGSATGSVSGRLLAASASWNP